MIVCDSPSRNASDIYPLDLYLATGILFILGIAVKAKNKRNATSNEQRGD